MIEISPYSTWFAMFTRAWHKPDSLVWKLALRCQQGLTTQSWLTDLTMKIWGKIEVVNLLKVQELCASHLLNKSLNTYSSLFEDNLWK